MYVRCERQYAASEEVELRKVEEADACNAPSATDAQAGARSLSTPAPARSSQPAHPEGFVVTRGMASGGLSRAAQTRRRLIRYLVFSAQDESELGANAQFSRLASTGVKQAEPMR